MLFALVANRACDPGSKLAATRWVEQFAPVPGLPSVNEDAAYRAMDLLLQHLLRARHRRHPGRPRRTRSSATTAATTIAIAATSTTTLRPPLARGWVPHLQALQSPPRGPAADRDRDGRHPQRDRLPEGGKVGPSPPCAACADARDRLAGSSQLIHSRPRIAKRRSSVHSPLDHVLSTRCPSRRIPTASSTLTEGALRESQEAVTRCLPS